MAEGRPGPSKPESRQPLCTGPLPAGSVGLQSRGQRAGKPSLPLRQPPTPSSHGPATRAPKRKMKQNGFQPCMWCWEGPGGASVSVSSPGFTRKPARPWVLRRPRGRAFPKPSRMWPCDLSQRRLLSASPKCISSWASPRPCPPVPQAGPPSVFAQAQDSCPHLPGRACDSCFLRPRPKGTTKSHVKFGFLGQGLQIPALCVWVLRLPLLVGLDVPFHLMISSGAVVPVQDPG